MKIVKTKFSGLFIYKQVSHNDSRGYFKELLRENIIKKNFPFLVMSYSKKNVIRGLHLQTQKSQGKFVSVIKGRIFDIALDLRKNSKTYGKYLIDLDQLKSKATYKFSDGCKEIYKDDCIRIPLPVGIKIS